ncbi:TIR domain-containing protein [Thalassomonas actiniarum]|uniref:Toll/interleukin-1 receptor domain-containing protein n=1 Tax=Thalassomonas actiniarum TaxID=485447 RepID=A0AAE9YX94_9GAMM|nr:TIR domain-containing protein [Thalassomonas actiniarum]WDE02089.1 toll/interleukin-1 receptor domain-containing protein [Thalassomonas actiniarum]
MNTPKKVRVFLSYLSEDNHVAEVIKKELVGYDERIEVFKADDSLRAGVNYKTQLRDSLNDSDWLLLIYTNQGKDWQWPIFEGSYFLAANSAGNTDSRLCCLYDSDEWPKPFSDYQSYKAEVYKPQIGDDERTNKYASDQFYHNSALFNFLVNFLSYPDDNPIRSNPLSSHENLIASASRIAEAFLENRSNTVEKQYFYLPRLELIVKNTTGEWRDEDWLNVNVVFGSKSQMLFRTQEKSMKWDEFKNYLVQSTGTGSPPLWLLQLEESVNTVLTVGWNPSPLTTLFYSQETRRFYRPQLSRVDKYLNGDSKFFIMLVEQLPSDFKKHEDLGFLLSGLISGGRFKFEFIDPLLDRLSQDFNSDSKFDDYGQSMLDQIVSIEVESAQHGLLDPAAMIEVFPESDRRVIATLYKDWGEVRTKIFTLISERKSNHKAVEDVKAELINLLSDKVSTLNIRFMRKATDIYARLVKERFPLEDD